MLSLIDASVTKLGENTFIIYFSQFSKKTELDISCELSPVERIHLNYQMLLSCKIDNQVLRCLLAYSLNIAETMRLCAFAAWSEDRSAHLQPDLKTGLLICSLIWRQVRSFAAWSEDRSAHLQPDLKTGPLHRLRNLMGVISFSFIYFRKS